MRSDSTSFAFNHVITTHIPVSFASCELPYIRLTCIYPISKSKIIETIAHVTITHAAAAGLQSSLTGGLSALASSSLSTCLLASRPTQKVKLVTYRLLCLPVSQHTTTTRSVRSHTLTLSFAPDSSHTLSHTEKRNHNSAETTGTAAKS